MRRLPIAAVSLLSLLALAPTASARTLGAGTRPSRRAIIREVRQETAKRTEKRVRESVTRSGTPVTLDDFGVSFRGPEGWKVDTTSGTEGRVTLAVMLLAPETINESIRHNMNLVFEDLSTAPLTLTQYSQESIEYERSFFDSFTLLFRDRTSILGKDAERIQFDASYSGTTMRLEQQWFIDDRDRAVVWTFADSPEAFDGHLPLFHAVVDSFRMR